MTLINEKGISNLHESYTKIEKIGKIGDLIKWLEVEKDCTTIEQFEAQQYDSFSIYQVDFVFYNGHGY